MTDTTITDAVCWPQDDGSGVPNGNEDYDSAGYLSLLAKYKGEDSYIGEDNAGNPTLQFNDVDTTNEQVDVSPGFAYIMDSGTTVQSADQTTYDTTLPNSAPYVVILPTEVVDLGLGTDTDNDLWLATDPTSNDNVYIRHGSGLSAPTDPNVKLGTVNSSDGSTTRANDLGTTSLKELSTGDITITGLSAGSTLRYGTTLDSSGRGGEIQVQTTADVGTTATAIWDSQGADGEAGRGTVVSIWGADPQGSSTNCFTDVVHFHRIRSPEVINQINNNAAVRSYSRSASTLELAMGSDTYDITAVATVAIGEVP